MAGMTQQELVARVEERALALARALDSRDAIARNLAAFLQEIVPERLSQAVWITLDGDPRHDKGLRIRLYEKPIGALGKLRFQLSGLLGTWSYGADISTEIYQTPSGIRVSAGVGAAAPYNAPKDLAPILSLSVRW